MGGPKAEQLVGNPDHTPPYPAGHGLGADSCNNPTAPYQEMGWGYNASPRTSVSRWIWGWKLQHILSHVILAEDGLRAED